MSERIYEDDRSWEVSVEKVLEKAAEIEKMNGRSNTSANIIRAYRELTGADLKTAVSWFQTIS